MTETQKPAGRISTKELFDMKNIKHEQMKKNTADLRKKMRKASKDAKLLYHFCLEEMGRYKLQAVQVVIKVETGKYEVACEVANLLAHPANVYQTSVQVDCTRAFRTVFSVVVTRPGAFED